MKTIQQNPLWMLVLGHEEQWHHRLSCLTVKAVPWRCPWTHNQWVQHNTLWHVFAVNSEAELAPNTGWLSSRTLAALRDSDENQFETWTTARTHWNVNALGGQARPPVQPHCQLIPAIPQAHCTAADNVPCLLFPSNLVKCSTLFSSSPH